MRSGLVSADVDEIGKLEIHLWAGGSLALVCAKTCRPWRSSEQPSQPYARAKPCVTGGHVSGM